MPGGEHAKPLNPMKGKPLRIHVRDPNYRARCSNCGSDKHPVTDVIQLGRDWRGVRSQDIGLCDRCAGVLQKILWQRQRRRRGIDDEAQIGGKV